MRTAWQVNRAPAIRGLAADGGLRRKVARSPSATTRFARARRDLRLAVRKENDRRDQPVALDKAATTNDTKIPATVIHRSRGRAHSAIAFVLFIAPPF